MYSTTCKSRLMKMEVRLRSCWRSYRRFSARARIDVSSAETGSSQMTMRGSNASTRAMLTR